MLVYRVARRERAEDLTGEGARLVGGRWNSIGIPLLYTSESRSLALLEILAHATILPVRLVMITLQLPQNAKIPRLSIDELPDGWNAVPATHASQNFGDKWFEEHKSLACRIPSAILPAEFNILINPLHLLAKRIKIIEIVDLPLDARLGNLQVNS